jgi:hypothetical protein
VFSRSVPFWHSAWRPLHGHRVAAPVVEQAARAAEQLERAAALPARVQWGVVALEGEAHLARHHRT